MVLPGGLDTVILPKDLFTLEPANIADLHYKLTSKLAVASATVAEAEVTIMRLKAAQQRRMSAIYAEKTGIASKEKWKYQAIMDGDPEVAGIREKISVAEAKKTIATSHVAIYSAYINSVSRELSRQLSQNRNP